MNNKQDKSPRSLLSTSDSPLSSPKRTKSMKNNRNVLLVLTGRGLKYFLLTLLGFAIALIVFHVFQATSIIQILLSATVLIWFVRIAVSLFCMFAIAMILESWG